MKPSIFFSLNDMDNYKNELDSTTNDVLKKYSILTIEYLKFVNENMKIPNKNQLNFFIVRGLDTITNVFNWMLYYTKNLDMTYYHCQKSFCFYLEFITQITDADKLFLQLSSRDAALYVYKKTIFEMNRKCVDLLLKANDTKDRFEIINENIKIYKLMLMKIIETNNCNKLPVFNNLNKELYLFEETTKIINATTTDNIENTTEMLKITDALYNKVGTTDLFFKTLNSLIVRYSSDALTITNCVNNINSIEFDKKINEDFELFIDFISSIQ